MAKVQQTVIWAHICAFFSKKVWLVTVFVKDLWSVLASIHLAKLNTPDLINNWMFCCWMFCHIKYPGSNQLFQVFRDQHVDICRLSRITKKVTAVSASLLLCEKASLFIVSWLEILPRMHCELLWFLAGLIVVLYLVCVCVFVTSHKHRKSENGNMEMLYKKQLTAGGVNLLYCTLFFCWLFSLSALVLTHTHILLWLCEHCFYCAFSAESSSLCQFPLSLPDLSVM